MIADLKSTSASGSAVTRAGRRRPLPLLWLEQLAQDVRVGTRALLREKSFCLVSTAVLALGICGVTAQFTIVNTALFDLLPFPEAERLMTLKLRAADAVTRSPNTNIMPADYEDYAAGQRSFARLAGYMTGGPDWPVAVEGVTRPADVAAVEHGFFDLLGVTPLVGRTFTADEDQPGARLVSIISHEWWQREFGGAADILNRSVEMRGQAVPIVGVMPPGFSFPRADQVWVPLRRFLPFAPRGQQSWGMSAIGRLAAGVPREQALAEFTTVAQRLTREHPDTNERLTKAEVVPLADDLTGTQYRRTIVSLLVAVTIVLVIACINVMNLQFTRGARRAHELGVRGALGATRGRLIRQLLTESALLAVLGGAAGVGLSQWCGALLHDMFTSSVRTSEALPSWATFRFDVRVLLFTLGAVGLTVLVSGLWPALLTTRRDVSAALKQGGRAGSSGRLNRLTRAFVVAQIALTSPLVFAALLTARSLLNQQNFDFGFGAARALVTGRFYTPAAPPQRLSYWRDLLDRFRSNPSFGHTALTTRQQTMVPDARNSRTCEIEGRVYTTDKDRPLILTEMISDGYFAAIGLGLLQGRDLSVADVTNQLEVAVVNAEFARRFFGTEGALGRRYRTIDPQDNQTGPWYTIVGIVPDFFGHGPRTSREPVSPLVFQPLDPQKWAYTIVARGVLPAERLAAPLQRAFATLPGTPPLFWVNSLSGHLRDELRERRDTTILFLAFGGMAVLLATVGLYGVTAFSVGQRTQEFGVRMALGATSGHVMRDVLYQGARQLLVGTIAGTAVIVAVGAAAYGEITGFLYRVTPFDPLILVTVCALLAGATLLACIVPARRASRADPMQALRTE